MLEATLHYRREHATRLSWRILDIPAKNARLPFKMRFSPGEVARLRKGHNLFGEESLALMWLATSGLAEAELAQLGFKKIAGEALIVRHSAERTPFSDRHPQGQDADVEALPEYEEWVEKEWEQFRDVAEE